MKIAELKSVQEIHYVFDTLKESFFNFDISTLSEYTLKLSNYAVVMACFEENTPVGVIAFYANDLKKQTAYITSILVDISKKGKGIGKSLMLSAESFCQKLQFEEIKLEVSKKNESAIAFYKKLGYEYLNSSVNSDFFIKKL